MGNYPRATIPPNILARQTIPMVMEQRSSQTKLKRSTHMFLKTHNEKHGEREGRGEHT